MPSLDRDDEAFLLECGVDSASNSLSGDFGKDSHHSSYGSTSTTTTAASTAATAAKDPEQWPLLGGVLPLAAGRGGVPPGLTAADILPLASDPFWRRLRAALLGLFWVVMVALLASVVVIVVNDPTPCSTRPALPPQQQTLNVSLPLGSLPMLQAVAASRY